MPASRIVLAACLVLSGCDAAMDKIAGRVPGDKIIVIAPSPLTLTAKPTEIAAPEHMEVLGAWTSVCIVLKDGIPHSDSQTMDAKFTEAMHSAKVHASVVLGDGSRMDLSAPTPGWRKSGAILGENELSGCASAGCLPRLPKGALVTKVVLSADPELPTRGVYWASFPDLPSKQSPVPSKASSSGGKGGSCG